LRRAADILDRSRTMMPPTLASSTAGGNARLLVDLILIDTKVNIVI